MSAVRYLRLSDKKMAYYPQSFTPADLADYADFLADADRVLPLRESYGLGAGTVAVRHDVDHNLEHAVNFARWEHDHGFRASYFVLPGVWYAREPDFDVLLHELVAMGHEVGLHSNVCGLAYEEGALAAVDGSAMPQGFCERAAEIMHEQLARLRGMGLEIVGTAAHGSGIEGIDNLGLWAAGYDPEDFGLQYEAYHLHRESFYLSDNRGKWSDALELAGDRATHVLIHPCHWDLP